MGSSIIGPIPFHAITSPELSSPSNRSSIHECDRDYDIRQAEESILACQMHCISFHNITMYQTQTQTQTHTQPQPLTQPQTQTQPLTQPHTATTTGNHRQPQPLREMTRHTQHGTKKTRTRTLNICPILRNGPTQPGITKKR